MKISLNFNGKYSVSKSEIQKIPTFDKLKLAANKTALKDEFLSAGTSINREGDDYIADIKADKETAFLDLAEKFGIVVNKID